MEDNAKSKKEQMGEKDSPESSFEAKKVHKNSKFNKFVAERSERFDWVDSHRDDELRIKPIGKKIW